MTITRPASVRIGSRKPPYAFDRAGKYACRCAAHSAFAPGATPATDAPRHSAACAAAGRPPCAARSAPPRAARHPPAAARPAGRRPPAPGRRRVAGRSWSSPSNSPGAETCGVPSTRPAPSTAKDAMTTPLNSMRLRAASTPPVIGSRRPLSTARRPVGTPSTTSGPAGGELQDVAILDQHRDRLQVLGQRRVLGQVPPFAMHRHGIFRLHQLVQPPQLVPRRMAGDMDHVVVGGHHLAAAPRQLVLQQQDRRAHSRGSCGRRR